jgi:hypothetical protein
MCAGKDASIGSKIPVLGVQHFEDQDGQSQSLNRPRKATTPKHRHGKAGRENYSTDWCMQQVALLGHALWPTPAPVGQSCSPGAAPKASAAITIDIIFKFLMFLAKH